MSSRRPSKAEQERRRISARDERYAVVGAEGRAACEAGKSSEIPYGTTGSLGDKMMAVPDRDAWLRGYRAAERDLEERADASVRSIAAQHPVAQAALRYAQVCKETAILRDQEKRTMAARALLQAIEEDQS